MNQDTKVNEESFEPLTNILHDKGSLAIESTVEIPKTCALTVPRTKQGYSRNPNGNFYWD